MNVRTLFAMILMMTLLLPFAEAQNLMITQVLYDPIATEAGGEAIEIYNGGESEMNLSGFVLSTEVSATDVTLPADAVLAPGRYYLVADTGWSVARDDDTWPGADHEETLGLNNADSGVALVFNSTIIDAVGWGDAAGINEGLWEGSPAALVEPGYSLRRVQSEGNYSDTDDNSVDFISSIPVWHNASMYAFGTSTSGSWTVQLEVTILNSAPSVMDVELLSDDLDEEGIQIAPRPKNLSLLEVNVIVADFNGASDVVEVTAEAAGISAELLLNESLNETHAVYAGMLEFPHYLAAGTYDVRVNAIDAGNQSAESFAQFEYLELLSLELDSTTLALESATGQMGQATGDSEMDTPLNPTIRNTGNMQFDLRVSGTELVGEHATIPSDALGVEAGGASESLTDGGALLSIALAPGPISVLPMNLTLETMQAYPAGVYRGSIEFSPVR